MSNYTLKGCQIRYYTFKGVKIRYYSSKFGTYLAGGAEAARAGVIGTEFVKLGTKLATHARAHTHTHTSAGGAEAARAGVPDDALVQGLLDVLILYLIYH